MKSRLNERDLNRIVRRVINEDVEVGNPCTEYDINMAKRELMGGKNLVPVKIENRKSFDGGNERDYLILTSPEGTCFCRPTEFFS